MSGWTDRVALQGVTYHILQRACAKYITYNILYFHANVFYSAFAASIIYDWIALDSTEYAYMYVQCVALHASIPSCFPALSL